MHGTIAKGIFADGGCVQRRSERNVSGATSGGMSDGTTDFSELTIGESADQTLFFNRRHCRKGALTRRTASSSQLPSASSDRSTSVAAARNDSGTNLEGNPNACDKRIQIDLQTNVSHDDACVPVWDTERLPRAKLETLETDKQSNNEYVEPKVPSNPTGRHFPRAKSTPSPLGHGAVKHVYFQDFALTRSSSNASRLSQGQEMVFSPDESDVQEKSAIANGLLSASAETKVCAVEAGLSHSTTVRFLLQQGEEQDPPREPRCRIEDSTQISPNISLPPRANGSDGKHHTENPPQEVLPRAPAPTASRRAEGSPVRAGRSGACDVVQRMPSRTRSCRSVRRENPHSHMKPKRSTSSKIRREKTQPQHLYDPFREGSLCNKGVDGKFSICEGPQTVVPLRSCTSVPRTSGSLRDDESAHTGNLHGFVSEFENDCSIGSANRFKNCGTRSNGENDGDLRTNGPVAHILLGKHLMKRAHSAKVVHVGLLPDGVSPKRRFSLAGGRLESIVAGGDLRPQGSEDKGQKNGAEISADMVKCFESFGNFSASLGHGFAVYNQARSTVDGLQEIAKLFNASVSYACNSEAGAYDDRSSPWTVDMDLNKNRCANFSADLEVLITSNLDSDTLLVSLLPPLADAISLSENFRSAWIDCGGVRAVSMVFERCFRKSLVLARYSLQVICACCNNFDAGSQATLDCGVVSTSLEHASNESTDSYSRVLVFEMLECILAECPQARDSIVHCGAVSACISVVDSNEPFVVRRSAMSCLSTSLSLSNSARKEALSKRALPIVVAAFRRFPDKPCMFGLACTCLRYLAFLPEIRREASEDETIESLVEVGTKMYRSEAVVGDLLLALSNLVCDEPNSKRCLSRENGIGLVCTILEYHGERANFVEYGCRVLRNLSDGGTATRKLCVKLRGIQAIATAMKRHVGSPGIQEHGSAMLINLLPQYPGAVRSHGLEEHLQLVSELHSLETTAFAQIHHLKTELEAANRRYLSVSSITKRLSMARSESRSSGLLSVSTLPSDSAASRGRAPSMDVETEECSDDIEY